jgi:hypothetical protein
MVTTIGWTTWSAEKARRPKAKYKGDESRKAGTKNRMLKRTNTVALLGLAMLAGCGVGPKEVSRPEYAAILKAFNALKRANDYRDAGTLIYEPRFLDAEKAVEELESTAAGTDEAVTAGQTARSMLKNYRDYLAMGQDIGDREARRGDSERLKDIINTADSIEFHIKGYISTLYSYVEDSVR